MFVRKVAGKLKRSYRAIRWRRSIRLGCKTYSIPNSFRALLEFEADHEMWLDWVYQAALEVKEGAFIDVGVNQGQTLAKMLRIAPVNQYIGIEPQPGCAFFVDEFIRINGLKNCSIVPIGFSDRTGLAELNLHSLAPGDSTASVSKEHRPDSFYAGSKIIPVFRGDELFSTLSVPSISLIKIDVEGAELEVLRGLPVTLKTHRPFVVFEVLNNYLVVTREGLSDELTAHRNEKAQQISSYFDQAGYRVFNVRGKRLIPSKVITPEVSADLSITDYVAVPEEMVPEIESRCEIGHPSLRLT